MPEEHNKQTEYTIPAGYTLDYVSGKQIKETKKELVRQRVVRALIHEYGFSPNDMQLGFSIGGRKKVDVAIFRHGKEHDVGHLSRAVICRPEPKVGKNTVRIRDFEQAASDLEEVESILREVEAAQYGLWTNGLDFFYVEKQQNIFRGNEELTLSDRALAFIASELSRYDFTRTDVDAKGVAYQELVGVNLRGDRGQYFTPRGHLADLKTASREITLGSVDIIATNPPFGSDIPITDKHILEQYELAHTWEPDGEGGFRNTGVRKNSVAPEILFIERCIKWLKPGTGRLGIVLPDGVLGNPAAEYIRWWIMRETQVLASVDLPVESFIAEANVNILTSLLFLRRKDEQEKHREALGGAEEYAVFMAVADKVGFDRRGNTLYKRTPEGEEIVEPRQHTERIRIGGRILERTLTRSEKIPDNDLPVIAQKYREFLREQDGLEPEIRKPTAKGRSG